MRVHSTGYKKDDRPSDRPVLQQSVILGSTPLPDKSTLGLGYVTIRGLALSKSRPA
jgi:hypothetical protein